jgi:RNA polymerase sigma-70 factor (ECF subfamily)
LRYLRVHSGSGCEDVAAETWLQVVRDLSNFIGDADGFRAWLFTIARHRAIDAARASASRPLVLIPDVPDTSHTAAAASAESEALERLSTERAVELVATLPAEQAEMVMLRVVAGLDVPVVARIVGKTPGAVRVAVHRGLRALSRSSQTSEAEVV